MNVAYKGPCHFPRKTETNTSNRVPLALTLCSYLPETLPYPFAQKVFEDRSLETE